MERIVAIIEGLAKKDEGQDLLEYGLLMVLIATFCIAAVTTVGNTENGLWRTLVDNLKF